MHLCSLATVALLVNDFGQVVGGAFDETSMKVRAFIWTPADGIVDLGTLGGPFSSATAINAVGQVVGSASPPTGSMHAFSWTKAGGMVDLGAPGEGYSRAVAVNDSGQVAGWSMTRAFSWTQAGGTTSLGTLNGDPISQAAAVSAGGAVVGFSGTNAAIPPWRAFVWTQARGMVDLGTLGGTSSQARAVSDSDQVVGFSDIAPPYAATHAFMWTPAGGMVDLGTLGGSDSRADAVNASGRVVGWSQTASGDTHATLWMPARIDATPPVLAVTDIVVDATSPHGVVVSFEVTATDDTDPNPVVTSTPASGSLFPIGSTTIECTATDASGNTANEHFVVYVKGAPEQLLDLIALVDREHAGPGTRLHDKLVMALSKLHAGDRAGALKALDSFVAIVHAQTDGSIPPALAERLLSDAIRIENVIA